MSFAVPSSFNEFVACAVPSSFNEFLETCLLNLEQDAMYNVQKSSKGKGLLKSRQCSFHLVL